MKTRARLDCVADWLNVVAALSLTGASLSGIAQAAALRTVALSGQSAPGATEGVSYSSFDTYYFADAYQAVRGPVLNDAGRAAFRANLTGVGVNSTNNQGIWSEGSGNLALVARTGNQAPGLPDGVNFARNSALELFTPVLNNSGRTAFFGGLADGSVGIWSEGSGNLALVARDGLPAPGTPEGVNHSFSLLRDFPFFPDLPKLNDVGQVSFLGNLTGSGINYTNDWGIWSEASGNLALVARGGDPAPGTPNGVNYDSFFYQTGFNDAGQSVFFAILTGSGVDPSNDHGIWTTGSGAPKLVVRSGSPAPGTPSGVNFQSLFGNVSFNNAGRVAFEGFLTGEGVDETNNQGLWSEGSGSLELVARRGSPAPGTPSGVNFDEFLFSVFPVLNDAGQTAFRANLTGPGVTFTNDQGIWSDGLGSLALVARTGSPAPGTPSGVRFAELHLPALNSEGQTAFRGNLTGSGINSNNDRGIWATDESGALQLIARKGSQLEVAPGDFRTISDLDFVSASGNGDGRASGLNNSGQLVFWARFTNGTQGVFVSSLVAHLPGDFNDNGTVDAADYVVWRKSDGTEAGYDTWRSHFGRVLFSGNNAGATGFASAILELGSGIVPEPTSILLAVGGIGFLPVQRRRRASSQFYAPAFKFRRVIFFSLPLAASAAILFSLPSIARAATIGFDVSAKSPAVIPFDPDTEFLTQPSYVTGRVPREVKGPIIGGTNINTLLGADTFYSHGYTGTNVVIASIESGHIWNGHETLTHALQIPNHPAVLNEFDWHNTVVGMILGGRRGGANPGAYQQGMAPDAQLYSGALARQFEGQRYAVSTATFNHAATFDQYRRAFSTGVNATGRTADVINSSWRGFESGNGSGTLAIAFDGFANTNPHTLFVAAAGNEGAGPDTVGSPAAAYNNLAVAALGPNPPYDRPSWFSSGGPNDYVDPVNGTRNDVRQVIDIAAPGENLSAAYYGGETGGNGTTDNPAITGPGPTGLPYGSLGGSDYYSRGGLGGTSFASPNAAGGAALLYDAAYSVFPNNADARDARVMKAVLMNSADKTFGWNNGQGAHPNGNGGVVTTQGLDNRVGTGRMNLDSAYDQFLTGTTDVAGASSGNLGFVNDVGWDFGNVVSGTTNDYFFDSPLDAGSTFTATLSWFRDRRINESNTVFDDSFDDLNLELWSVVDGTSTSLISESNSLYNESEHLSFALPVSGDYALRVRWFKEVFDRVADADQEFYGLAWSVGASMGAVAIPEPRRSLVSLLIAVLAYGALIRADRPSLDWRQSD
jgi:hypothetical protein